MEAVILDTGIDRSQVEKVSRAVELTGWFSTSGRGLILCIGENGVIEEEGTPKELEKQKGSYWRQLTG